MSSADFCSHHQRWLNEFGWCDECGEPVSAIKSPLPLTSSPRILRDDFGGREPGTAVRHCSGIYHVFADPSGPCQCGEEVWPTEQETA